MAFNLVDVKTIYGENKNLKEKDVKTIVKWVQNQPHLPNIGDFDAILFLRKCHYRLFYTPSVIDTFFTSKILRPEVFLAMNFANSPQLQGILDTM
ncbi:hypothetical protein Zmor_020200 [Zophobas morio]|uniref:Uncharacterized protein n=1 Tax=Zophobas morio TaxID=2755281 RepID=A0AA38I3X0_9CUCU|nr:hypothetical protein Zmor_020200 [Zophobas morio]